VFPALFKWFAAYLVISALAVVRFGFIAATESNSRRKGRAYFIASILFSSWFVLGPLLLYAYDRSLPVFEFHGQIVSVEFRDSSSRHYSAYLVIQTTSGGEITVHSSDRSDFVHSGELVDVRYYGDTGELIKAYFYAPDGHQEGMLHSASNWNRGWLSLIGLFCVWASIRKYRRDPEGAEEPTSSDIHSLKIVP
jgi:hypothetical protein